MSQIKLHTYRYGESLSLSGISLGVTRYLPRGVRREEYVARGYFDVWLPILSPSRELMSDYRKGEITFAAFARKYRSEMRRPDPRQVIQMVAATARAQTVNLGCFCEDESCCHRSVLADLVLKAGREFPPKPAPRREFASSPCMMPEIED